MRQNLLYIVLFGLCLLGSGCAKDSPESAPRYVSGTAGAAADRTWNDGQAGAAAATRSVADLNYVLEIWTTGNAPQLVLRQTASGTAPRFDLRLVPGTYDFLFWADNGATSGYTTDNARGLREVTLVDGYTPGANHDAFACAKTGVVIDGGFSVDALLRRPVAAVQFTNKDGIPTPQGTPVSVIYRNIPTRYDVLTGRASAPQPTLAASYATLSEETAELGGDFLFVPDPGREMGVEITVGAVVKTLDPLPLEVNKRTIVTAKFQ